MGCPFSFCGLWGDRISTGQAYERQRINAPTVRISTALQRPRR